MKIRLPHTLKKNLFIDFCKIKSWLTDPASRYSSRVARLLPVPCLIRSHGFIYAAIGKGRPDAFDRSAAFRFYQVGRLIKGFCGGLIFIFLMLLSCGSAAFADSGFDAVLRSVMRVSGTDSSGEAVFGTAFLMQGRGGGSNQAWLVTAGHVFSRIRGGYAQVTMRRQSRGVFFAVPVQIKIRDGRNPLYVLSGEYDLAALKVALPGEVDCCILANDFAGDDARLARAGFGSGVKVLIPGYPYGEACNEAGFAFVRDGVVSSFPVLPGSTNPVFYVDFEVFEGYSGAPVVFSDGGSSGFLAGMVIEEVFLEELRAKGGKTARTRRGLGLAKVLSGPLIRSFLNSLP